MTRGKRTYRSPLREARAAQTQERILEAAMELLGEGASALTVPAVARRAGVAVPTVYRYFPSKEVLEDAVAEHARSLVGVGRQALEGLEGLIAGASENWTLAAQLPHGAMTVLMTSICRNLEDTEMQEGRRRWVESVLGEDLAQLREDDREHLVTLVQALCSSVGQVAYRRAGCTPEESGAEFAWLLRTLHGALVLRGS